MREAQKDQHTGGEKLHVAGGEGVIRNNKSAADALGLKYGKSTGQNHRTSRGACRIAPQRRLRRISRRRCLLHLALLIIGCVGKVVVDDSQRVSWLYHQTHAACDF